jgi:AAA+ superfamily predicted ATPase
MMKNKTIASHKRILGNYFFKIISLAHPKCPIIMQKTRLKKKKKKKKTQKNCKQQLIHISILKNLHPKACQPHTKK